MSEEDRELSEMFEKMTVKRSIAQGAHSKLITARKEGKYCFLHDDDEILKGDRYVTVDLDGNKVPVCESCYHCAKRAS